MKHDQPSATELDSQEPKVSEKRRRLLQASAASASLIGTLRSGAAFANTSAFQCLKNDEARYPAEEPQIDTGPRDGWLEASGWHWTFTPQYTCTEQNPDDCGSAPDDTPVTRYEFDGQLWEDDGSGYLTNTASDPRVDPPPEGYSVIWGEASTPAYALYYFKRLNDYTDIVARSLTDHHKTEWQGLTGSCWTSLGGTG